MIINNEEYQEKFQEFCRINLHEFYENLQPFYLTRGYADSMTYFINHYNRFKAIIEMLVNHINPQEIHDVSELGSWYPYTTYYYKLLNQNLRIDLYDIICREMNIPTYNIEGVRLYDFNLCTEQFPAEKKYDLIVLSEVMEHLPMNLFRLEKMVIDLLNPSGYLLVTYPMHGLNAKDYEKDLTEYDFNKLAEPHLREFTEDTVPLFFKQLTKIDEKNITYWAYGRIKVVLYRR